MRSEEKRKEIAKEELSYTHIRRCRCEATLKVPNSAINARLCPLIKRCRKKVSIISGYQPHSNIRWMLRTLLSSTKGVTNVVREHRGVRAPKSEVKLEVPLWQLKERL